MRFLHKSNHINKTILVLSDLHLGAGTHVDGFYNFLEDFHYDEELVDLLDYYSSGEYASREVELIINGDLFDLLAVPFVKYFDDEYWSEEASLAKLKMILDAHPEVVEAFVQFVSKKKKKIIYIIGNHDAEFVFKSLRDYFLEKFPEDVRSNIEIVFDNGKQYNPVEGVALLHGHEYERAHHYHPSESLIEDKNGKKYFIPPWGSYFVTRVINKFKEERDYINAVRPIPKLVINGIIYDSLFTLRFAFASVYYFFMVRFIYFFKQSKNIGKLWEHIKSELEIWRDYEDLTRHFFADNPSIKVLIVGHTHGPTFKAYGDGTIFINTGTWTDMHDLDLGKIHTGRQLTYAQIDVFDNKKDSKDNIHVALNSWKGRDNRPYEEFI